MSQEAQDPLPNGHQTVVQNQITDDDDDEKEPQDHFGHEADGEHEEGEEEADLEEDDEEDDGDEDPNVEIMTCARDNVVEDNAKYMKRKLTRASIRSIVSLLMPPREKIKKKRSRRAAAEQSPHDSIEEEIRAKRKERNETKREIRRGLDALLEQYLADMVDLMEDTINESIVEDEEIKTALGKCMELERESTEEETSEFEDAKQLVNEIKRSHLGRTGPLMDQMDGQLERLAALDGKLHERVAQQDEEIRTLTVDLRKSLLGQDHELDRSILAMEEAELALHLK